tara:strand:+ start:94 stop:1011 length:918 start_codon:yes stop_codon:yes gene_type:complete
MNNIKIKFRAPSLTEINSKILVIDDKEGDLYYKANQSIFKVATTLDVDALQDTITSPSTINSPFILGETPIAGEGVALSYNDFSNRGNLAVSTDHGTVLIGMGNGSFVHFQGASSITGNSSSPQFYFDNKVVVNSGEIRSYDEDLTLKAHYSNNASNNNKTKITLKNNNTNPLLEVFGNLNVKAQASSTGKIEADGDIIDFASDKRLKENIIEIPNPLDKIKQLRGVYYDWKKDVEEKGFYPNRKTNEIGMIAQEIEQIIPQAIEPAPFDKKYKTIKYNRLIPLLVECIKEQQKQIDKLKSLHKL